MLTEADLAAWYQRLNLGESTQTIIDQVRHSDPARRVGGGRSNVSGFYPSRKMGVTIQFESHRVELAAIYEMEYAPQTLEFYDQPNAISLDYSSASGRRQVVRHTPDFFVIRQDSAGSAGGNLLAMSSGGELCETVWPLLPPPLFQRDRLALSAECTVSSGLHALQCWPR